MAKLPFSSNSTTPTMLLLLCLLFAFLHTSGAQTRVWQTGVCYGTQSNKLPSERQVLELFKTARITRLRLYSPHHSIMQALSGTNIELMLGVPNSEIQSIASSQDFANSWVSANVQSHPNVKFRYIVVGHGVTPLNRDTAKISKYLLPALNNIWKALSAAGLGHVRVSSAFDHEVVIGETTPPSRGAFRPEVRSFINPIIQFLVKNHSPFLINMYPYSSYAGNRGDIPDFSAFSGNTSSTRDIRLEFAVFRSPQVLVQDGPLGYVNLFDAKLDSVNSALEKAGGNSLDVVVSETGWPTAGGNGANPYNAEAYNNNMIRHVSRNGSPKRPNKRVEVYIFNLIDENQRKGDHELQKHWGIFRPNLQAKYVISFWSPTNN